MAVLRMFAGAREAAGTARDVFDASTVGELLDQADAKYGSGFSAVRETSRIWLNGDATDRNAAISERDEVAVLPPVSGGA